MNKSPCISTPCIKCRYYKRRKCWLIGYADGIQTGTPGTTPAKGGEKRNGEQP